MIKIQTPYYNLSTFNLDDAEFLFHLNSDPEVILYTGDQPFPSVENARSFIAAYDHYEKFGFGRWLITSKETGEKLGWCGLKQHNHFIDLGFRIKKASWNTGIASETAEACVQYAFNHLNVDFLVGRSSKKNKASLAVLKKIGFNHWKEAACEGIKDATFEILINPSVVKKVDFLVNQLSLTPHPEGGYYKEIFRSNNILTTACTQLSGNRNYATSIYFLLTVENFSAFHRIKQDELWFYHEGSSLTVHMISPKGEYSFAKLGPGLLDGEVYQFTVPAGYWFASEVREGYYSLVSCVVVPGFDFNDFELADRKTLTQIFPQHCTLIATLTRL